MCAKLLVCLANNHADETSDTGHIGFIEFINAAALPFGRRAPHRINVHVHPRQPNSRFCLGACNSWERATHACNPQDPRPAINPTGRARLEQASKRAIESSRAGEASASATGPRQLACTSQANEPTQLRLNYERRTSTRNSVSRPLLDFFAKLCDLSFLELPADDVRG